MDDEFIQMRTAFLDEHCEKFPIAEGRTIDEELEQGENQLIHMRIWKDYLQLVENSLTKHLEEHKMSFDDLEDLIDRAAISNHQLNSKNADPSSFDDFALSDVCELLAPIGDFLSFKRLILEHRLNRDQPAPSLELTGLRL